MAEPDTRTVILAFAPRAAEAVAKMMANEPTGWPQEDEINLRLAIVKEIASQFAEGCPPRAVVRVQADLGPRVPQKSAAQQVAEQMAEAGAAAVKKEGGS